MNEILRYSDERAGLQMPIDESTPSQCQPTPRGSGFEQVEEIIEA